MPYVIETAVLKAAMICASTEQTRYYLNGVNIGTDGRVATTDGHRLFIGQLHQETPELPRASFIIPLETLKRALTRNKQELLIFDEEQFDGIRYEPIDGIFPDVSRVVPTDLSGTTAQFNPAYVGDFGKIAKLLGGSLATIHHNGDGAAGISFGPRPDCIGVLMPIRADGSTWDGMPALRPELAKLQPATALADALDAEAQAADLPPADPIDEAVTAEELEREELDQALADRLTADQVDPDQPAAEPAPQAPADPEPDPIGQGAEVLQLSPQQRAWRTRRERAALVNAAPPLKRAAVKRALRA